VFVNMWADLKNGCEREDWECNETMKWAAAVAATAWIVRIE